MFKKYYKEANDDIETDRELISEIFRKADKPSKTVPMRTVYRFASCAAAVFALCAILYIYPHTDVEKIASVTEQGLDPENTTPNDVAPSEQDEKHTAENSGEGTITEENEKAINESTSQSTKSTVSASDKSDSRKAVSEHKSGMNPNKPVSPRNGNTVGAKQDAPINASRSESLDSEKNLSKNEASEDSAPSTDIDTAALNEDSATSAGGGRTAKKHSVNAAKASPAAEAAVVSENSPAMFSISAGGSNAAVGDGVHEIIWSTEAYFEYLGIDVFKSIKLPHDMKVVPQEKVRIYGLSDETIIDDEAVFSFKASEERLLMLYTSKKDSSEAFESGEYKIKNVNGAKVYYNDGEGVCGGYMHSGGTGFVFYACGMTDSELETALASLK